MQSASITQAHLQESSYVCAKAEVYKIERVMLMTAALPHVKSKPAHNVAWTQTGWSVSTLEYAKCACCNAA